MEAVEEVVLLPRETLLPPPATLDAEAARLVSGIHREGTLLLEGEALLSDSRLVFDLTDEGKLMSIGKKIGAGFGLSLLVLLMMAAVAYQVAPTPLVTTDDLLETRAGAPDIREMRAPIVAAETASAASCSPATRPTWSPTARRSTC